MSVGSRTGSHEESREQEKEKHVWGDNASRRASVMTMLAIPSLQDLADDEEEDASKDNTDMADPEEDDLQTRQRQRSERVRKAISNARVATLDASIDLLTIHIWVFLWQLYTFFSDTISKIWWLIRKCGPSLVIILLVILILDLLFFAIRTNACSIPMVGYVPVLNQIECPPTNILLLGVLVCPFTSTDLAWCQNKQQPLRDNPIFHTATETTRYPPVSSNAFNFTPIGQTFQDNNEKLVHLRRQAQWLAPMTSDMVQWDYALLELDMYVQASPIQPGAKGSIREGIIELRYLGQKLSPLLQKYSASVPSFVELQIYKTRSTTDALSTLDQSSWFSAKLPLPSLEYTEAFIARLSPWLPLTPTGLQTLYNVGARLSSSYISITSIFSGKPSIDYSAIPFILDSHVAFLNPHLSSIGLVASDITENLARQLEVLAQVCSIAAGDRGMAHASLAAIRERKQAWLYQLLITLRSWEPVNKEARAEWQIAALEHFQVSSNGARRAVGYMARNITGMKESNARLSEYAGQLAGIAKAVEGDLWGEDGGGQSGEEDGKGGSKNNVSLRQKIRHEDLMTIIQQMSASTDVLAEQHRVLTAGEKGEVVGRKERGGR